MLISIITVNYNNLSGLKKTINSALSQTYQKKELIVIDGGSEDGGKEFISSLHDRFAYSVSEKDKGAYDAMNKGISHSHGDYLIFMNSGDVFFDDNTLSDIFERKSWDADIIYGFTLCRTGNNMAILRAPHNLDIMRTHKMSAICHQSAFIKRELFNDRRYNIDYKILADYDFFYTCYRDNCVFEKVEKIVSIYDTNGMSANPKNKKQIFAETCAINEERMNSIKFFKYMVFSYIKQWIKVILPPSIRRKIHRMPEIDSNERPLNSFKQM